MVNGAKPDFMAKHEAERDEAGPPQDKLQRITKTARELRDKQLQLEALELDTRELKLKINVIEMKDLPDMMLDAGIDKIGLEAEGNLPAYNLECKPYYYANIKADSPEAPQAFAWLEKEGHGDLVKRTYTVTFGKGEDKEAKKFEAAMKKLKVDFDTKLGVPWNSLTAFLKEQIEKYEIVPPLALLGAIVGRKVHMKPRKDTKPRKS